MKILDIPQSGKRGVTVSQDGTCGQISRALVIPDNPWTERQLNRRQVLGTMAHNWRTITEAQRLAWIEAGKEVRSGSRLGQSGPLTGFQLFIKVNCNLQIVGEPTVVTPPPVPAFDSNVVKGVELTNPGGVVAIISFHSGEDRIVKRWFRDNVRAGVYQTASQDAIVPRTREIMSNPRSSSAKFRWAMMKRQQEESQNNP